MKTLRSLVILTLVLAGAASEESIFAGTWQGKIGDPAVILMAKDDGGKLSGTVIFYLLVRTTEKDALQVDGKATETLIGPKVDGKVLSFEVRHHTSHGSAEYGPNIAMRLELLEEGKATLGDIVLTRAK